MLFKDNVEVSYGYGIHPVGVPRVHCTLTHTSTGILYANDVGIRLCTFISTGFLRTLGSERAEVGYPVFCMSLTTYQPANPSALGYQSAFVSLTDAHYECGHS